MSKQLYHLFLKLFSFFMMVLQVSPIWFYCSVEIVLLRIFFLMFTIICFVFSFQRSRTMFRHPLFIPMYFIMFLDEELGLLALGQLICLLEFLCPELAGVLELTGLPKNLEWRLSEEFRVLNKWSVLAFKEEMLLFKVQLWSETDLVRRLLEIYMYLGGSATTSRRRVSRPKLMVRGAGFYHFLRILKSLIKIIPDY